MTAGTSFQPIETVQRYAAVGAEFWDLLTSAPIADGLAVSGRIVGHTSAFRPATVSPRGVHALIGLPGLRELEVRTPAPGAFEPPPTQPEIQVDLQVTDRLGRFLPTVLRVTAPLPGLVTAAEALEACPTLAVSVPDDQPPFLFSAPTRAVTATAATVRTHVRDRSTETPAAHAIVKLTVAGLTYFGVADETGQALVTFPYPPFIDSLATDSVPAGEHGTPSDEQVWPMTVEVRSLPVTGLDFSPGTSTPLYHSLLCQPAATIWADIDDTDPVAELSGLDLGYGHELFLKTTNHTASELLIDFAP